VSPYIRIVPAMDQGYPTQSEEWEPTDEELGWDGDVPIDIYGNTEEEPE
jgi:hypothetical protein